MEEILDALLVREVIYPIIIIMGGILLYLVIKSSIKRIFHLRIGKIDQRRAKTLCGLVNNIIKYIILVCCALSILEVYNISTKGIIASLGVAGIVVGLAFQDTLKDLLAGFSIIFENAYAVGDTITVGNFKGKVISLGLKTTKIQAINGDIEVISNSNITSVINHSLDDAYDFIDIPVSYDEDIEKVEAVLNNILQEELKTNDEVLDVELLGIEKLDSSSINFRIKIKTHSMKQYGVRRQILKRVKQEFNKNKITIPYEQVVIHNARV